MTGCEPMKSEMSVRSFDPELTVTMSGLPSKLPTNRGPGWLPTEKDLGVLVVEEATADARQQHHIVRLAVADQDVGYTVTGHVLDDRGHRAVTGLEPGPRREGDAVALRLVEQDRDVVGALVGDHQVGPAVAVDIGHGDPHWVGAGEEAVAAIEGWSELAVAQA